MPSRQLFIIRVALVVGVAVFAALAMYQRMRGTMTAAPLAMESLGALRYALWGLSAAAVLAAIFLRSRMESATPALRRAMTIIGWAFGEGVALLGTVQYYLGADVARMQTGLVIFATTLILLPVPREPVPPR
jgi:hypothetical protein